MLDADCFAGLTAAAQADLSRGRVAAAAARLTQALELWRGRAGEDLPREGWLGGALQALDEQRLIAAEQRAQAWLELGRHGELVPELTRLLAEHPLRESLWRQLMVAHYWAAGVGEALATYARARRILAEELGIEPGEELTELHRAILRRDVEPPVSGCGCRPTAAAGRRWTNAGHFPTHIMR